MPSSLDHNTEQEIKNFGLNVFNNIEEESKSIFNKDWWYGNIMEWSMKNEDFKTQMFRFVDVLPYLNSGTEVVKHLKEYFAQSNGELPPVFNFGVGVSSLAPGLLAGAVRKNVTQMAKMFITGETPQEALPQLNKARSNNIGFTVDLLGESTLSEQEAQEYHRRYSELLTYVSQESQKWSSNELLDFDDEGEIPRVNVSVKITSLYSQIKDEAWSENIEVLKERLRPLFRLAQENFCFLNIDMEQYSHKNLTLEVFKQLICEEEFKHYRHWGIVIQAYLRDSLSDIQQLCEFAKQRQTSFTIRLVKGAYWDYEFIHSQQKGWPIPVYTNKKESDANFENCCQVLLENFPFIKVALGSHNVRSISFATVLAEKLNIPKKGIEIQMLYGMADPIKKSLIKQGYRLREYATVGELIPGMAYLVRRLLENTSNESFLKSKFADNVASDVLLESPKKELITSSPEHPQKPQSFHNEPPLDFTIAKNRDFMKKALAKVQSQFGKKYPLVINGRNLKTQKTLSSLNPSHPQQVIGEVFLAQEKEADAALVAAQKAYKSWSKTSAETRAKYLDDLADEVLRKRFDLCAWIVSEVGKTWAEADGDICETIDFCRYYARDMRELAKPHKVGHALGETSHYVYTPRGVSLVIAPWNFPLAILTGMVAASIVTGNTVIMKPAEQSSVVASLLMDMLVEVGVPPGVVNFLPGYGEEVGEYLVNHKDISIINFTGSREVGLHIVNKASLIARGQRHVKKCIIEMGGKNAIIVDSDADLDEAIAGVLYSAFAFSGQKCSACSRVLVLSENYDRFIDRLLEATRSINFKYAEEASSYAGPVIDQEAQNKILSLIEEGKKESTLLFQGQVPDEGFFIPPTIFVDVKPDHKLAQEEIFGPVLTVIKCKNIDEAIDIANDTDFGLTGGLYSRSPANIEKVKHAVHVGNFYINRGITAAMVDRHPFGGFKLSGLGSKTGGPDYLKNFTDPKVIIENTMRRGFAPTEE